VPVRRDGRVTAGSPRPSCASSMAAAGCGPRSRPIA